jgi:hypothetical protein
VLPGYLWFREGVSSTCLFADPTPRAKNLKLRRIRRVSTGNCAVSPGYRTPGAPRSTERPGERYAGRGRRGRRAAPGRPRRFRVVSARNEEVSLPPRGSGGPLPWVRWYVSATIRHAPLADRDAAVPTLAPELTLLRRPSRRSPEQRELGVELRDGLLVIAPGRFPHGDAYLPQRRR